jgi:hypothetical protein
MSHGYGTSHCHETRYVRLKALDIDVCSPMIAPPNETYYPAGLGSVGFAKTNRAALPVRNRQFEYFRPRAWWRFWRTEIDITPGGSSDCAIREARDEIMIAGCCERVWCLHRSQRDSKAIPSCMWRK